MTIRTIYLTLVTLCLLSCNESNGNQDELEKSDGKISIGPYRFNFPSDFQLINEKGIDSNVGKVSGDSLTLGFDYGHYSDKLVQSIEEYLESRWWQITIEDRFMKPGITYNSNNRPQVEVIEVRESIEKDSSFGIFPDYVALCVFEGTESEQPIFLPEECKQHSIEIDTLNGHFRKIVIADDPESGITGIYLSDYKNVSKTINSPMALSMATRGITEAQQDFLLEIFRSVNVVEN